MKTIELQNNIIRKILSTNDDHLLEFINSYLSSVNPTETYKLNRFEKQIIQESLTEYENDNVISNKDVFSKTDKWLKK
jgi:hypothetical protein